MIEPWRFRKPYITDIPSTVQRGIRERLALALSLSLTLSTGSADEAVFIKVTRNKSTLPWRTAPGFRYEVLLLLTFLATRLRFFLLYDGVVLLLYLVDVYRRRRKLHIQ